VLDGISAPERVLCPSLVPISRQEDSPDVPACIHVAVPEGPTDFASFDRPKPRVVEASIAAAWKNLSRPKLRGQPSSAPAFELDKQVLVRSRWVPSRRMVKLSATLRYHSGRIPSGELGTDSVVGLLSFDPSLSPQPSPADVSLEANEIVARNSKKWYTCNRSESVV
jgi:hypothetical protein